VLSRPKKRRIPANAASVIITDMAEVQPTGGLVGRTLGHYRLLEALGSGGMGEVYLAEDTKLNRRVALKVLPAEMAAHPEKLVRFEREAKTIASLNHPGIVTVYSIDEVDGLRFITMEHVAGETLGKTIPQHGFPLERLLPLAISLADALAAAHRQGILHRDLKPDNVMLTPDGRLKVLDFGLAKLRDDFPEEGDRTTKETQSVTQDGRIVGTVAYMSPEQAQALPVDNRSDIFSLGILLYEMATGERPFRGQTNLSVLSSILKDQPRSVSDLRDDIPRPLARMIQRTLEKRPEDRYQSTTDLRRDLEDLKRDVDTGELRLATTVGRRALSLVGPRRRWVLPAVASLGLVLAAVVALAFLQGRTKRRAAADGRQSVAVFYFDNLSGDPRLDWLRTGLTDMLVTNLSQSPGLRVLGTSRLYQLLEDLGHRDDRSTSSRIVQSVAERAQATTALVGSFVRAGDLIRIQASLEDPRSGEVLASERVEGNADEGLFGLVDELTSRVRRHLESPRLAMGSATEKKLADVTTSSVEAYKAYAEGSRLHEREQERESLPYFEKAVAADPGFAMALAKLSVVYANLGDKEKAREYSARAIEKAANLPPGERYYIEGRHYSLDPSTIDEAIAAYQKAVDAAPDHTSARNNLAQLLIELHRYPEALVHLEELRRRGMTFPGTYGSLAEAYVVTGHPERAEEALRSYVADHPDRAAGYMYLGGLLLSEGRVPEGLQSFDRAASLAPADPKIDLGRFAAFVLSDRWDEAAEAARRVAASGDPNEGYEGHAALAVVSLYRGDLGEARRIAAEAAKGGTSATLRAGARLFRGELEAQLGRYAEAVTEADRALAEKSQEIGLAARAHALRAICLTGLGRGSEAKASVAEVNAWLGTIPAPIAEPRRLQFEGELALARGDHAQAAALLRKAAKQIPARGMAMEDQPVEVRYFLARAALEDGEAAEARDALQEVVEAGLLRVFQPVIYVRSLSLLAGLEDKAGHTEKARKLLEQYVAYWKDGQIDCDEVARAGRRLAALRARPAA
jgi:serine/threonine protein kinase/tetratricopeptide (TPR) repeat protein